jgi:hypothetical protein
MDASWMNARYGELIISDGNTTTLLDLVEEPLDQIACTIEVGG